ncbi:MAG TPA: hypothetical protein VE441_04535, partial [Mycobacterium sp.]|nr:hypothetical protein [Mycobacterium sp.]
MSKPTALLLAAALLLGLAQIGSVASASVLAGPSTLMCKPNDHVRVYNHAGKQFIVRDPKGRGSRDGAPCIRNYRERPNFRLLSVPPADGSGKVAGYPSIMRGCIWQVCTHGDGYPVPVRKIRGLRSTWHTRQVADGVWDAAYDIWFGKSRTGPGGRATRNGAELMLWLNHRHVGRSHSARVTIDHRRWELVAGHRACDPIA